MYGDSNVIRGLARTMRDVALDIRQQADRLVGEAERTHWTGLAAEAMRRNARDRSGELRRTAGLHDDAAQALERHAAELDRLTELIASVEHRVLSLVDAARDRVSDLVDGGVRHVVPEPLDRLLGHFVPPGHGSRAWLDIDLPGVSR